MAVDNKGATPGHRAALNGHAAVVRLLRRTPGMDISARDATGRSLFFHAAMRGRCEVLSVLLSTAPPGPAEGRTFNAAANGKDVFGATPVIAAARSGCGDAVAMLLDASPDSLNDVDDNGHSLLWWVKRSGNKPLRIFMEKYYSPGSAPHRTTELGELARQKRLSGTSCFCDVCTRINMHGSRANAIRCLVCLGGSLIVCSQCSVSEAPFCDVSHKVASLNCTPEERMCVENVRTWVPRDSNA
ncbi:ankyrin repeat domain-containing protein [Candidatus Bathyarchaeota archaeon]|nr:ankyrin repeat domain-containing protein [Candidatus Bathyarchaeota archaeon]